MAEQSLFEEIALAARVLAIQYPADVQKFQSESAYGEFRRLDPQAPEWLLQTTAHARDAWHRNCIDCERRLHELVKLVYKHLPEVMPTLKHVRLVPEFHHNAPPQNWEPILDELRRIEDAALAKALQPLTPQQEKQKHCYDAWQRGETLKGINQSLGVDGYANHQSVTDAIRAWAEPRGLPVRKGRPGRPARR